VWMFPYNSRKLDEEDPPSDAITSFHIQLLLVAEQGSA
jgi:hypothetical protein